MPITHVISHAQSIALVQGLLRLGGALRLSETHWTLAVTPENQERAQELVDLMDIFVEAGPHEARPGTVFEYDLSRMLAEE